MSTKLNILFYAKRSRTTTRLVIPLYLRVTIQGKRMEVTANRFVLPDQWSTVLNRVKGNSKEAEEINSHLDYLRQQVYAYHQEILEDQQEPTVHALREKWFGVGEKTYTLLYTAT